MKLAFITPTAFIDEFGNQGDFHLALSHLLERDRVNAYERVLVESKKQIVLDNGLFENHIPEGIDSLIIKAKRLNVEYFFAPDFLYNAEKTFKAYQNTLYILEKMKLKMKLGVVVQASSPSEYFDLYDRFQTEEAVHTIGLSILSVPRCFGSETPKKEVYKHKDEEITQSRIKLLQELKERNNNKKPVHLLGLGSSYEDVLFAKENCPFVVSNDTSCCFQSGYFGHSLIGDSLEVEGGKVKEKVDFKCEEISNEQHLLIQENINKVKNLLCK